MSCCTRLLALLAVLVWAVLMRSSALASADDVARSGRTSAVLPYRRADRVELACNAVPDDDDSPGYGMTFTEMRTECAERVSETSSDRVATCDGPMSSAARGPPGQTGRA